jgi:hypothetical protein
VHPADASLIEQIQQATRGGRALLRGLGRRGKALERDQPERAALLLAAVRAHPLYKGGRLAFDMLEIEDLMLDGPPEDALSQRDLLRALDAVAGRWRDLVEALRGLTPGLADGAAGAAPAAARSAATPPSEADRPPLPRVRLVPEDGDALADLPELRSSDYLYDFVVLGFLDVLGRAAEGSGAGPA